MKKLLYLGLSPLFCFADVVNEYRDYKKDGYFALTHLRQNTTEMNVRGYEQYAEFNLNKNVVLTQRLTTGYFFNKEENLKDKVHIASAGLRFNWFITENLNLGFKTNLVHRDYNEVKGLSYRFMPIIDYTPLNFLNLRYIYEFDYIPSASYKENRASNTDQETALYIRIMPWNYFNKKGLEYELKMATGIGTDKESGENKYNLSYEHNLYWTLNDTIKLKYSRVKEDNNWGHQTIGLVYEFNF